MSRVKSLLQDFADLVYPTACAVCEIHVEGRGPLCPDCGSSLRQREIAAACPSCAMPLAQAGDPCPYCMGKGESNFEKIVRLGIYDEPIRGLIHRMKYHRRWALAEFFADRLFEQPAVKNLLSECDCLVPVPLHRLRQISRGYNQSEIMTRRLAANQGLRWARPLVRVRNTPTQTQLQSRTKREENLRDAFGLLSAKRIAGRRVVIIDDIVTTGATLQSVARALKPAKPASLSAIVIAVADPKGNRFSQI